MKPYSDDEEYLEHQIDVKHKFHDTPETFETYECPDCKGHFLLESEAMESIDEFKCPYCEGKK
jgi:DNA-directed RNA polymerase subunit RPC12/RpoP